MPSLDDLEQDLGFTVAERGKVTFLPEPERRPRHYPLISVDDHLVEPPDTFEGRMPAAFGDRAPHIVERDGAHVWVYDGQGFPNVGFNAVVGRPVLEYSFEPTKFEHMRRGAWDVDARVADMDINGVYASLCFPSFLPGFAGQRLQLSTQDPELALAATRAWNDWHLEAWCGAHPDRFIPCQLPYLLDPELGAQMIRENAERGFKAVTFSENPHALGLPSIHTGHWDPLLQACEETGTVVNLHIGSSGTAPSASPDAPPDVTGVLFFGYSMFATVDWLFSKIPVRFPDIKLAFSEGGIGWVPALLDRLDHMSRYSEMYGTWDGIELSPAEVLHRNFWFCSLEDPSTFPLRERIGVDRILVEQDYPHCDSTWPDTQEVMRHQLATLTDDEAQKVTWKNASELYRHPVPAAVQADPEAF
ncbi:amidohydrolase family protein [Rhabdothermincola salaria]|uniref:amidohydrolase family protein n=1 Tax=Rhabdothermincola salaria TaxID=2903142 RepID=UPI001E285174|nr:amidohydrolase family protein [Rhabdothermincola salaria]MCD9623949.1 amidohydrolase [Rhabdothermincola salaria]